MSTRRTGWMDERPNNRKSRPRRGNVIVLAAFLMVFLMFMIACAVDVGYIYVMRGQLQRAVDAAALAGGQDLVNSLEAAQAKTTEYLVRNPVGSEMTSFNEAELASKIATFQAEHGGDLEVEYGDWNTSTHSFTPSQTSPSSLQVTMTYPNLPFFFGRVLGHEHFSITASSTAMFQPRDIVLVLDFSASMNDDSAFQAIGKLPQTTVEASLQNCWNDLGPPSYGDLTFTPSWVVADGVPQNDALQIPHVTAEYRNQSAYVTSTHSLTSVRLTFSDGVTQTFSGLSGTTGTFQGTSGNSGKRITRVQVRSWGNYNTFGTNGESFSFSSNSDFITHLGLNAVTYPYSGGSWSDYVDYIRDSSSENEDAGYWYKFGGMNLVEYWIEQHPSSAAFSDGWKIRAEPTYALKDSVDVFMDFISAIDTNDRVALVIYDAADGNAILEHALTTDLPAITNIVNHRQAGHYHSYTNIGAGMQKARETLNASARPNSCKSIVLMTDGLANWNNGSYNLSAAAAHVSSEAAASAAKKYKIFTLSLGVEADTATMQTVADTTDGKHYNIPGGTNYTTMHNQLKAAFKEIANARPLLLVK